MFVMFVMFVISIVHDSSFQNATRSLQAMTLSFPTSCNRKPDSGSLQSEKVLPYIGMAFDSAAGESFQQVFLS